MSSLAELFETGTPYLRAVEVSEDGGVAISFDLAGRTFTLPKEYVAAYLDDLLSEMPPWCEAGWLEREFLEHEGKLASIAKANGFSAADLRAMTHYAAKQLNWRIQEGHDIRRWELYVHFFEDPDPDARSPVTAVGKAVGIPAANALLWAKEAAEGKFFSKAMSLEKLAQIHSDEFPYVYFPGEVQTRDYALFKGRGWPHLPRGLLSDLLPRLDQLVLISATFKRPHLTLSLEHFGQPLVFTMRPDASPPSALSDLQHVRPLAKGNLAFHFAGGVVSGKVLNVTEASAGSFYLLKPG